MTAHIVFEALDNERPASLSSAVVNGLLRGRLGFDGVVVTDDLEMKAITDHFSIEEVAVQALSAGVDILLVCHQAELARRAIDAIVVAVQNGRVSAGILQAASSRVARFAERFARPPVEEAALSVLGCEQHRAVLARLLAARGAPA